LPENQKEQGSSKCENKCNFCIFFNFGFAFCEELIIIIITITVLEFIGAHISKGPPNSSKILIYSKYTYSWAGKFED
jgi:hypothetical protein